MSASPFRQALLRQSAEEFSYHLGNAALALRNFDEAVELFQRALDVQATNARALFNLAAAHAGAGRAAEADAARRRAASIDPGMEACALFDLAQTHVIQGRQTEATALLEKAAETRAGYADPLLALARFHFVAGRQDQAVALYVRCENDPSDELFPEECVRIARILLNAEKYDSAIVYCRRALQGAPDMVEALEELGRIHHSLNHLPEAAAAFQAAIATGRAAPFVYCRLSAVLDALGKTDEAVAAGLQGVEAAPSDPLAHMYLGLAYESAGRPDAAIAAQRSAIALNEVILLPHLHLTRLLAANGRAAEAEATCRHALKYVGEGPSGRLQQAWANLSLGGALRRLGRLAEAIAAYREATELYPEFPFMHMNLGAALQAAGDLDGAVAACRKAVGLTAAHPWTFIYYGDALYAAGQEQAAAAAYQTGLAAAPILAGCLPYLPSAEDATARLAAATARSGNPASA